MASANNQMEITRYGLNRVSEELIAERIFNSSKIELIGNPLISGNGVMSSLDDTSGAFHAGLEFTADNTVKVICSGTIGTSSTDDFHQCLWRIVGNNNSYIDLSLYKNSLQLNLKNESGTITNILNITVDVSLDDSISTFISLNSNTCYYNYTIGDSMKEGTEGIPTSAGFNISGFTGVYIGNDLQAPEPHKDYNFWRGSVFLSKFRINVDDSLYYAPSDDVYFEFSKVLVGDGSRPLTDTSGQISGRIYAFPIEEIVRTGSNVLIKTTIDEDAHLTIKEVGLYITINDEPKLFSVIRDLNITKTANLGYELIFKVNLDINIVNVEAFPEVILKDVKNVSKREFLDIKMYTLGTFTDMEVAVGLNATEIGYNKAQVFYRYSDELNLNKENWLSSQEYHKLRKKVHAGTEEVFDESTVVLHGNVQVTPDGVASGFSSTNYITMGL